MSNQPQDPIRIPAPEPQPGEPTVPLDDFCAELSLTVRSPEAIASWRYRELAAGRNHDTEAAYMARFLGNGSIRTE
jgi:hypothetical protein